MNLFRLLAKHLWKPAAVVLALCIAAQIALLVYQARQPSAQFCSQSVDFPCGKSIRQAAVFIPPLASVFLLFAIALYTPRQSLIGRYVWALLTLFITLVLGLAFLVSVRYWETADLSWDGYGFRVLVSICAAAFAGFLIAFLADRLLSLLWEPGTPAALSAFRAALTTFLTGAFIFHLFLSLIRFILYGVGLGGN